MAEQDKAGNTTSEPRGLGEHARGLAGEYAHEQGWGLNEEERTAPPKDRQPTYGGKAYDYSAQDFGDEPTDMTEVESSEGETLENDVEEALRGSTQGSTAPSGEKATTREQLDFTTGSKLT